MKKILALISFAMLMAFAVSCERFEENPPYYQISYDMHYISSTGSPTDFSNIAKEVDPYINKVLNSENDAVSLYNQILSKTKDASYTANNGSYYKLFVAKYIAKKESENVIRYEADPSYTSPVGHIWDEQGSRDTK